MAIEVRIEGNTTATGFTSAGVTPIGQLVVAPFDYDLTEFIELDVLDTAYSFYPPIDGKQFVITSIVARADKNVSNVADATVIIYEGDIDDTLTVDRVLLEVPMVRFELLPLPSLNLLVNQGKFINAKTTEASIFITIMGYYRPV